MKRNSILKVLNPILALLFLNQILTGMLNEVIPKGAYEFFHEGGGTILTFAVILHVILNWNWVKATFLKKKK